MSMQYVRDRYGVPAKRGMEVSYEDRVDIGGKDLGRVRSGRITKASHRIYVRFSDDNHSTPIHPRDEGLVYYTIDGPFLPREGRWWR